MTNWTDMHRHDFDDKLAPVLFDLDELPGQLVAEPGTLFADVDELEPIPCNICGATDTNRLSLGRVALCTDSTACYARNERQHRAELAELFPEMRAAEAEPEPAPVPCLLCGRTDTGRRLIGRRRYDQHATEVCDEGCNPAHRMDVEHSGSEARFACSCGAVSKWFRTDSPIAAAAHRHADVIARIGE